jgi:R.HinP1I restriction endonuclease
VQIGSWSPEEMIKKLIGYFNNVIDTFSKGQVRLSPRGSLKIGKITIQRKGGTPDPTSLQFKINPLELFKVAK